MKHFSRSSHLVLICMAAGFAFGLGRVSAEPGAPKEISYNRDIRPILSDKCFYCHGPDPEHREADLRLDELAGAKMDLGGYQAIVPGDSEESEAVYRILTDDDDELMPPPKSDKVLTKEEKDLIVKWIEQGADYEAHWSFVPPERVTSPEVSGADWIRNPIDAFVLAKLEEEGLQPSAEASRETLIRRVTLDLTGLPPTPKEVDAYLGDESPDAFEKLVDRLLESERYGERMALSWLNAARYADTNGYQKDTERQMWIWRDWVIKAYNENKPFDEFTVEQIAGDMLPDASVDQQIASAFNRNHRINGEGGVIPEEYRVEYVIDRVETTGTVWLGLSVGCARCHSHKFDPISQKDFYSLFAYFNNIPENGRDGNKGNAVPVMTVPVPGMESKLTAAKEKVEALEKEFAGDSAEFLKDMEKWELKTLAKLGAESLEPMWETAEVIEAKSTDKVVLERLKDGSFLATGPNPAQPAYTVTIKPGKRNVTGIRLETLRHPNMTKGGLSRSVNGNFVLTDVEILEHRPDMNEPKPLKIKSAQAKYSQNGYPIKKAFDGDKSSGWAVLGRKKMTDSPAVFVLKDTFEASEDSELIVRLRHDSGSKRHAIGRFRLSLTSTQKPALEGKGAFPSGIIEILNLSREERTENQGSELSDFYRELSPVYAPLRKELASARKELEEVEKDSKTTIMVMQEMEERRPAFLLNRGQYDQPGEEVLPGIPESIGALPEGAPNNRLGFAQWLVDPANPLTARVTVNRYWQQYFGIGLVKTIDDFGAQGEFPSHAELLDWLASEFVRTGWDVKAMQKLIVTSATYRQSSATNPSLVERDPQNRLLARGPRFRLYGEAIRDQALAVSGLLVEHSGGPSVKPYQPVGLWEEVGGRQGLKYTPGRGDDLYRRSMYTFWKRAVAPPTLIIFDSGGRERCDVALRSTNTPLQALATLNDDQFVEAARFLAERMILEGGSSPEERISHGWRLALARHADEKEIRTLAKSYQTYLTHFKGTPIDASELLKTGEKQGAKIDPSEHAAYTAIANILLNLDEFVTRE